MRGSSRPLPNTPITPLLWCLQCHTLTPSPLLVTIIYLSWMHLEATGRVREHLYRELAVIFQGRNIYLLLSAELGGVGGLRAELPAPPSTCSICHSSHTASGCPGVLILPRPAINVCDWKGPQGCSSTPMVQGGCRFCACRTGKSPAQSRCSLQQPSKAREAAGTQLGQHRAGAKRPRKG